jgi:hypothetical protein
LGSEWETQAITTACNDQVQFWINTHPGFVDGSIAASYRVYGATPGRAVLGFVLAAENDDDQIVVRAGNLSILARAVQNRSTWKVSNTGGLNPMVPAFLLMLKATENMNCTATPSPVATKHSSIPWKWIGVGAGAATAAAIITGLSVWRWKVHQRNMATNEERDRLVNVD